MAQIIKADMTEMVFEERDKAYGAYPLRKGYPKALLYSVITAVLLFLIFSFAQIVANSFAGGEEDSKKSISVKMNMEDLPPPPALDEEKPPPPPPPKPPPPQIKTVAFKIPEPTPEEELDPEELEKTIAEVEELKEAPNIGIEDKEGDDFGVFEGIEEGDGDVPEVIVEKKAEPDINAFIFAEEEPKPVNMGDIQKAIGYPQIARDAGIEGNVVVRVLVDELGRYKRHKIINQVHPILTKSVEKHINKLKFTPAIQGGKPIPFWVNIPFNFKLIN